MQLPVGRSVPPPTLQIAEKTDRQRKSVKNDLYQQAAYALAMWPNNAFKYVANSGNVSK